MQDSVSKFFAVRINQIFEFKGQQQWVIWKTELKLEKAYIATKSLNVKYKNIHSFVNQFIFKPS